MQFPDWVGNSKEYRTLYGLAVSRKASDLVLSDINAVIGFVGNEVIPGVNSIDILRSCLIAGHTNENIRYFVMKGLNLQFTFPFILPGGITFPGTNSSTLITRIPQWELATYIILELFVFKKQHSLIVNGPSGNGKSWLAILLTVLFIKLEITVIYECAAGYCYVYGKDGVCRRVKQSTFNNEELFPETSDPNAIHIFDCAPVEAYNKYKYSEDGCHLLLIASQNSHRSQIQLMNQGVGVYLPSLTLEEFIVYSEALHCTEKQVKIVSDYFGTGSIRPLAMIVSDSFNEHVDVLNAAIDATRHCNGNIESIRSVSSMLVNGYQHVPFEQCLVQTLNLSEENKYQLIQSTKSSIDLFFGLFQRNLFSDKYDLSSLATNSCMGLLNHFKLRYREPLVYEYASPYIKQSIEAVRSSSNINSVVNDTNSRRGCCDAIMKYFK